MQLSEREIEDFIFKDLTEESGASLKSRGMNILSMDHDGGILWKRQLDLDPYGIADIVGFYRSCGVIHIDLLELKAVGIDSNDFDQIFRYKCGLIKYLKNTFKDVQIAIACYLIGNGYKEGHYIQNNSKVGVIEYEYGLTGLQFNTHVNSDWHRSTENSFKNRKQKKNGQAVH